MSKSIFTTRILKIKEMQKRIEIHFIHLEKYGKVNSDEASIDELKQFYKICIELRNDSIYKVIPNLVNGIYEDITMLLCLNLQLSVT